MYGRHHTSSIDSMECLGEARRYEQRPVVFWKPHVSSPLIGSNQSSAFMLQRLATEEGLLCKQRPCQVCHVLWKPMTSQKCSEDHPKRCQRSCHRAVASAEALQRWFLFHPPSWRNDPSIGHALVEECLLPHHSRAAQ